ncbi:MULTISPECIES: oxygen-regulated invasion protein OrgB [Pseudomonas]|nr:MULTISPECIES: oxygen-regulated invasion protein OrgB [Pseudomonas]MBA6088613.1 oxygen-regulated invasion protein OrgB [Pseudomonas monteilii]MBA6103811.1 oxygen-regulated invasion protein OrgB [Pseudomonas monteilii]MCE0875863.1 oxygen-regulated invasion protein OrgB [Pseudomonas monteilii]MCE0925027.1 oxygen-regulated invasion protein OrgB [Pseudomonas monteilii]MCE0930764.1 oxygen-regulated invasion protein OrgB [Pseudomonas monteilii]
MLESIRTLADIPSTDALLLRHEERTAARNRRLLMQQARERAKACMAEAQQEADSVRANAFQDGYSQGVLQAAADVSGLLLQSRVMASALQAELVQAARSLLGDLLMDDRLLDALLQRWHSGWVDQGREPLQIMLPLRCKAGQMALNTRLKGLGVERVDIRFHAQERYLFRLADQVVELDIGASQERLSPRLIAQLKQLPESVRQLDEASKNVFVNWAADLNKEGYSAMNISKSDNSDEH